jgi:Glycosyl hydrolase catalytic core
VSAIDTTGTRNLTIRCLAFHWYDYGLSVQLDRLTKYGKQFWITELASWNSQNGAQIDTLAKQAAQMRDMVATCESRADVFRYAWFTGRTNNDVHFTGLLSTPGRLTDLGQAVSVVAVLTQEDREPPFGWLDCRVAGDHGLGRGSR